VDETRQLLSGALGGDADARSGLLERLRPRLVLWAAARMPEVLRGRIDAEDAAQEIILTLHSNLDQFKGGNFRAWMFTVAKNKLRDMAEHAGALKRRTPEPQEASQTSPSMHAIRTERAVLLREAVAALPEDYRKVIQLRRFEELETPEVAKAMDRSENAVRILYFRALKMLREELVKRDRAPSRS
jgi:RNA polymerase sigma-70 factor (ECF subfamily)